jgi:hypothetical protein
MAIINNKPGKNHYRPVMKLILQLLRPEREKQ